MASQRADGQDKKVNLIVNELKRYDVKVALQHCKRQNILEVKCIR